MWKRFRSEGETVLYHEDTHKLPSPVANPGGAILDTEAGLSTHCLGAAHNDSQDKHRPGSFGHYVGITVSIVCLYLMFISCLPSPTSAVGAAGTAQGHPLPKWVHYFLDSQEVVEPVPAPSVQEAPAPEPAAVPSPASAVKEAVLPPAAELPSKEEKAGAASPAAAAPPAAPAVSAVAVAAPAAAVAAVVDGCADVKWRPDLLVGKCFGLESAPVPEASKSWEACRDHCCEAKEACITWQYQSVRGCVVGGGVRLGLELAAPSAWCEETSPQQVWQGRRLTTRTAASAPGDEADKAAAAVAAVAAAATCAWSAEELPFQCFGLGPERVDETKKDSPTKGRLSLADCQQWCCDHDACQTWQWREDKGCFGGKEGHCEKDNEPYVGGRKCVEGSC
jgi:hypothetical protein